LGFLPSIVNTRKFHRGEILGLAFASVLPGLERCPNLNESGKMA